MVSLRANSIVQFSLILSIMFPLFPGIFGNSPIHLVILNLILAFLLLAVNLNKKLVLSESFIIWNLIFISFLIPVGVGQLSNISSISGMFALLKFLYIPLFMISGYLFASNSNIDIDKIFVYLFWFSFALVIFEFLGVADQYFFSLYEREERHILMDKITFVFGVTYYAALYFLSMFIYWFYRYLNSNKPVFLFYGIANVIFVLLTQSRSIFIGMVFLLLFFIVATRKLFSIFLPLIIFTLIIFLFGQAGEYTDWRYVRGLFERLWANGLFSIFYEPSFLERYEQLKIALQQPYFYGGGHLEGYRFENFFSKSFATKGLLFGALFYFYLLALTYKIRNESEFMKALFIIFLTAPVTLFSSSMWDFPKFSFLWFFLIGFFYGKKDKRLSYA